VLTEHAAGLSNGSVVSSEQSSRRCGARAL
jgi:hypothetical protein